MKTGLKVCIESFFFNWISSKRRNAKNSRQIFYNIQCRCVENIVYIKLYWNKNGIDKKNQELFYFSYWKLLDDILIIESDFMLIAVVVEIVNVFRCCSFTLNFSETIFFAHINKKLDVNV